ncbi:sialate O-acetylesterase [Segetibacter sp. 3557_3]|uniref:sialate O-acetylesterase n=1 Tax=Segetibacter sp. 3557_3 TaxID=2547429 RepID=UPI0010585826|nr:sialate O-acetylesterase [Segetibacter sp. 3557_3]TDH24210.1 sialate O-acetylesterase [Segetibacter sp. 3557_3]
MPFLLLLALPFLAPAQLRLPKVIGSNMVLQRNKPLPVWGWTTPGEQVNVSFAGQQQTTKSDTAGYWKVTLAPMNANEQPQTMTITAGNTITLSNLLVGEVWLCSGQSNMEYPMKRGNYAKPARGADSAELELKNAYPSIRIFNVQKVLSTPDVTTTGWNEASGEALEKFSAAGFFFAKNLYQQLRIPIGVINSSWGGSRIEPWTPAEGYKALPAFAPEAEKTPFMIDSAVPGKNYRSMIEPLAPFALRGFLWYQGESNCMMNDGMRYADKMQALVEAWRNKWGINELAFYSVQLAPYSYTKRPDRIKHTPETLPEFWEAQVASEKIPFSRSIVVTDLVDNLTDIHPSYKWEVGRRLALVALETDYQQKVVSSGPLFTKMKRKKGRAVLSFQNANGLKTSDGKPLSWFSIAGYDGVFKPADAVVRGNRIVVSTAGINKPSAVRFAWHETAMPNLVNGAGLPAVPFRTDNRTWRYQP